ncbi:cytochrome c [Sorangium sp. So ce134]
MPVRTILLLCFAPFVLGALQGCGGSDDPGGTGGGDGPLGACPPDSAAQQAAGSQAIATNCVYCHGTMVEGPSRGGAPPEANLDDPAYIRADGVEILEQLDEGVMPPTGRLPDATIEDIRVYLACEAE